MVACHMPRQECSSKSRSKWLLHVAEDSSPTRSATEMELLISHVNRVFPTWIALNDNAAGYGIRVFHRGVVFPRLQPRNVCPV